MCRRDILRLFCGRYVCLKRNARNGKNIQIIRTNVQSPQPAPSHLFEFQISCLNEQQQHRLRVLAPKGVFGSYLSHIFPPSPPPKA